MSPTVPAAQLDSRVQDAARDLGAGRAQAAVAACEEVLAAHPGHAGALHLLGVALTRLDRPQEAIRMLELAIAAAPASAPCHVALGNAWRKAADPARACEAFERALALSPGHPTATYNLALAAFDAGDTRRSVELLAQVARADPADFDAAQLLVDRLAALVRAGGSLGIHPPTPAQHASSGLGTVTVGFCSVQPEREARARASIAAALQPAACELIVVRDARSLAEGFNRILDAATGEVVVLCHDDIEVLSPRLDQALAHALQRCDIVGVAGSDRVSGPAVLWSGHPHVHGWVSYPRDGALEAAPLGFRAGLLGGMQALDGVFMAMRTEAARRVRFDAATFDAFHFYDLDFTYRAHLAGLRLAVSTDILLLHASEGRFADDWKRHAQRFLDKFPQLRAPQGSPHWYGARFADRGQLLRFYGELRALCNDTASSPER